MWDQSLLMMSAIRTKVRAGYFPAEAGGNVMSEMVGSIGSGRVADQGAATIKARESSDIRKVAVASAIGNMIEYYDFTLYATATALVFNKIFFPSTDPLVGSLLAFATFFVMS